MSDVDINAEVLGAQFSPALVAEMKRCRQVWGMGFPVISDALLMPHLLELQKQTIVRFCKAEANLFKYQCWLEEKNQSERVPDVDLFLVLASDGTTCWGKTYYDAVKEARKYDTENGFYKP